jgi:hypothetical protein
MAPAGTYVEANGLQVYYEVHGGTATSQSWATRSRPPPSMRYPGLVRCLVLGGTQFRSSGTFRTTSNPLPLYGRARRIINA